MKGECPKIIFQSDSNRTLNIILMDMLHKNIRSILLGPVFCRAGPNILETEINECYNEITLQI